MPDLPPTAARALDHGSPPRPARYRRERDLPRLLRGMTGDTLPALERLEAEAEDLRRGGGRALVRHAPCRVDDRADGRTALARPVENAEGPPPGRPSVIFGRPQMKASGIDAFFFATYSSSASRMPSSSAGC